MLDLARSTSYPVTESDGVWRRLAHYGSVDEIGAGRVMLDAVVVDLRGHPWGHLQKLRDKIAVKIDTWTASSVASRPTDYNYKSIVYSVYRESSTSW
jgi:hypothetical protein